MGANLRFHGGSDLNSPNYRNSVSGNEFSPNSKQVLMSQFHTPKPIEAKSIDLPAISSPNQQANLRQSIDSSSKKYGRISMDRLDA